MKKNPFTLIAVTFISGLVIGLSAMGLFSFTNPAEPAMPMITKISAQDANFLFRNYYNNASPSDAVFKGFEINRDQLTALNMLANENQDLAGFRIYMGHDNSSGSVGIMVGVTGAGKDATGTIYRAAAAGSGPCPPICDGASTITGN